MEVWKKKNEKYQKELAEDEGYQIILQKKKKLIQN